MRDLLQRDIRILLEVLLEDVALTRRKVGLEQVSRLPSHLQRDTLLARCKVVDLKLGVVEHRDVAVLTVVRCRGGTADVG
jgi:hypothetical protein